MALGLMGATVMRRLGAAALLLSAAAPALAASPAPAGAASCSGCHAVRGTTPVPPIAGRPASEIMAALTAFRTGARPATIMNRIVPGFTLAELDAIATWWAAQPPAPAP